MRYEGEVTRVERRPRPKMNGRTPRQLNLFCGKAEIACIMEMGGHFEIRRKQKGPGL